MENLIVKPWSTPVILAYWLTPQRCWKICWYCHGCLFVARFRNINIFPDLSIIANTHKVSTERNTESDFWQTVGPLSHFTESSLAFFTEVGSSSGIKPWDWVNYFVQHEFNWWSSPIRRFYLWLRNSVATSTFLGVPTLSFHIYYPRGPVAHTCNRKT